jgi:hypothetical protein
MELEMSSYDYLACSQKSRYKTCMSFTYGQCEALLARLYGADETIQRGAFRARIQNLRKHGIPLGFQVGKGKNAVYEIEQIYQWAFCLELAEFGLDPTVAVRAVRTYWKGIIYPAFKDAMQPRKTEGEHLLCMLPQVMSGSWTGLLGGSELPMVLPTTRKGLGRIMDNFEMVKGGAHDFSGRVLAFSTTRIVHAVAKLVEEISK